MRVEMKPLRPMPDILPAEMNTSPEPAVHADRVHRLLDHWIAAWQARDGERLAALYSATGVYEAVPVAARHQGAAAIAAFISETVRTSNDFALTATMRYVCDRWAGVEWIVSGTHTGDYTTARATRKPFRVRGMTLFELDAGKIQRSADYYDGMTWLQQLGLVPVTGPQELPGKASA